MDSVVSSSAGLSSPACTLESGVLSLGGFWSFGVSNQFTIVLFVVSRVLNLSRFWSFGVSNPFTKVLFVVSLVFRVLIFRIHLR